MSRRQWVECQHVAPCAPDESIRNTRRGGKEPGTVITTSNRYLTCPFIKIGHRDMSADSQREPELHEDDARGAQG